MRPVPVFPDYLVKLVMPGSRSLSKPAVICRCVSLVITSFCTRPKFRVVPDKTLDGKNIELILAHEERMSV